MCTHLTNNNDNKKTLELSTLVLSELELLYFGVAEVGGEIATVDGKYLLKCFSLD